MTANPYTALLRHQRRQIKFKHGCAACEHRGKKAWVRYLCAKEQTPGPKGFCLGWWLDDDFEGEI